MNAGYRGTNQTNKDRLDELEGHWVRIVGRILSEGFYGEATLRMKVADGVIQTATGEVVEVLRGGTDTELRVFDSDFDDDGNGVLPARGGTEPELRVLDAEVDEDGNGLPPAA